MPGERLLDSYSLERAPVGAQIVARANQSRRDYAPLNQCFRDTEAADPVAAGLEKLAATDADGARRRAELTEALDLKNFEFNAQGVELNQRCVSAAVIQEAGEPPEQWARDPQLYVQPTTRPGAKIPHHWLVGADGRRVSTLDVVGKGKFSLVTGISGSAWVEAAAKLNLPYLRTVVIGAPGALDLYYTWYKHSEIDEGGALLVRPDGVVAWRNKHPVRDSKDAERRLRTVLSSVLDQPEHADGDPLLFAAPTLAASDLSPETR